jgi:hypothetical protein
VEIFRRYGGLCKLGCKPPEFSYFNLLQQGFLKINLGDILLGENLEKAACCTCPYLYENYCDALVKEWVADDRAERAELWRQEQRLLHRLPDERGWRKQRFDPVAKDQFFSQQPQFYLEAVGVSGLTFTRIAKVRIPSTHLRLFVDVAESKVSKHQRRKARRYGIGLLTEETRTIDQICSTAVNDFWATL